MVDENELTHLQRSRIRMQAMIPIIRAMEAEVGVERTHELVREALDRGAREKLGEDCPPPAPPKMPFTSAAMDVTFAAGGALEYDVLREDEEAFDINVTGCQYKALMVELGAVDLGGLLFCDNDYAAAESFGLDLVRTQTCMQGANHCDFRYRLKKS